MLLPETHRSSLPYIASLALQGSLVLALAIPWTVQTLKNTAAFPALNILHLPLWPEKPAAARTESTAPRPSTSPRPAGRLFHFSPQTMGKSDPMLPVPPEEQFDFGTPDAIAGASLLSSSLTRAASTPPPPKPAAIPETHEPIAVGGRVQAAKLIRQVQPVYPPLARQARIQGVVLLEAIVGTDGSIQQLRAISGHPLLIPAAVLAVQQWLYRPTFLNDQPVQVKTTIEVHFNLS